LFGADDCIDLINNVSFIPNGPDPEEVVEEDEENQLSQFQLKNYR